MGNASSQSEAPTTNSQSQDDWKPQRLCGTLPAEIVLAERYVQQLWHALDMPHDQITKPQLWNGKHVRRLD